MRALFYVCALLYHLAVLLISHSGKQSGKTSSHFFSARIKFLQFCLIQIDVETCCSLTTRCLSGKLTAAFFFFFFFTSLNILGITFLILFVHVLFLDFFNLLAGAVSREQELQMECLCPQNHYYPTCPDCLPRYPAKIKKTIIVNGEGKRPLSNRR